MINYELAILIGIFSFVYTYILTRPNAILNGVYNKMYSLFKTDERLREGKPIHPLFMVIMFCEKCFAGQAAFWLFLFINLQEYFYDFSYTIILQHLFFVTFTILVAVTIKNIYIKYIEEE